MLIMYHINTVLTNWPNPTHQSLYKRHSTIIGIYLLTSRLQTLFRSDLPSNKCLADLNVILWRVRVSIMFKLLCWPHTTYGNIYCANIKQQASAGLFMSGQSWYSDKSAFILSSRKGQLLEAKKYKYWVGWATPRIATILLSPLIQKSSQWHPLT